MRPRRPEHRFQRRRQSETPSSQSGLIPARRLRVTPVIFKFAWGAVDYMQVRAFRRNLAVVRRAPEARRIAELFADVGAEWLQP